MGYYTVLCDYLPDNPGQYVADKYYNASTTDVEAVYEIAKAEQVDGIWLMPPTRQHCPPLSWPTVWDFPRTRRKQSGFWA